MQAPSMEAMAAQPHVGGLHSEEKIVDLFAGGGGASTAILMATGRHPDVAVNHDPNAVALHTVNHPSTRHFCCDVFEVDPVAACSDARGNPQPVGLLWASPDCTHHSKARGGKPADKKIRALAWVVIKWASALKKATGRGPRCIFLENVEEFQDWGPLGEDDRPVKARKGEIFRVWVSQLEALGYVVDWRELVAADFGAPTTRKRLFLVARNDGRPIVWPEPTHAPRAKIAAPDLFSKPMLPWRPAADIIDWSLPCPSIFSRKKALAPKTQKRIARGIKRFVVEAKTPFIVPVTHSGDRRSPDVSEPLATVTSANRGEFALAVPTLTPRYGEAEGQKPRTMDVAAPYPTVVPTGNGGDLTTHFLSRTDMHSSAHTAGIRSSEEPLATVVAAGGLAGVEVGLSAAAFVVSNNTNNAPQDVEGPTPTVTTGNRNYLVQAAFAPLLVGSAYGEDRPGAGLRAWSAVDPARTVTSSGAGGFNLAAIHLTKFSENSIGTDPSDPLHTAMAGAPRHGMVAAHLCRQFGMSIGSDAADPMGAVMPGGAGKTQAVAAHLGRQFGTAIGRDLTEPHPTVMTDGAGGKSYLTSACMISYYGTGIGSATDNPLPTVVTKDRHALNAAYMEQANTGMTGRDAREPLSTIVAGGGETSGWSTTQRPITAQLEPLEGEPGSRRALVVAFLREHFGEPTEAERADPLATTQGRLRFGLVMVEGAPWQITDIGMRMLVPRELYGAQGFPADYIIDRTTDGTPLTKTAQTRMAGNSVSPPPAAAMIAANDPLLQRLAAVG